jgi:acetyl-CoA acetyltransferase
MRNVYIVAAKRTAFGTFGGALKSVTATELGAAAARAAVAQIGGKVCICIAAQYSGRCCGMLALSEEAQRGNELRFFF